MTAYRIRCRVSGGVTGTRESYLKRNGTEVWFDSKADADAEAAQLNRTMNGPHACADFRYSVESAAEGGAR